jgi:hypothetical protein
MVLRDHSFVPTDVCRYFHAVSSVNERRNEKLLKGLAPVAAALNAIDIEPVLLKGALGASLRATAHVERSAALVTGGWGWSGR